MSLLHRIVGGGERRDYTFTEPPDWLWDAWVGDRTYSGKSVNANSSLGITGVYAAVTLLATQVGSLPMIVYQGESQDRERAKDSWQWDLLRRRPNPETTADLFYETLMGHLQLWGNFYVEKQFGVDAAGRRRVVALWPILPSAVKVCRNKSTGLREYEINGSTDRRLDSSTIVHGMGFGYDGLKGLSPIQLHRQTFGTILGREEYMARFYANNASPSGVLQVAGQLSEEAAQRLKAGWEAAHRGGQNAGRVAVLEDGVTWQSIGMPLEDQQYVQQKLNDINECARIFQIPPEMLGGERNKSLTYSNVEGQSIHFKVYSLNHWLVRIENTLRSDPDIFPTDDLYPEFLSEGLLRGDSSSRVAYYKEMIAIRAMVPNEVRERENMPRVAWGDDPVELPGAAPANTDPGDAADAGDGSGGGTAEPGDGGAVRSDLTREELRDAIEQLAANAAPVVVPPAEIRFEEGAFHVEAHPAEVRFEAGSIRGGDITVEAPETHVHQAGRRTVEFSDGEVAVIHEEEVNVGG